MRNFRRRRLSALLAICLPALAVADPIRGLVVEQLSIPSDPSFQRTVGITLEEAVVLSLEDETPFLQGIQIELHLSNTLKENFDSFALAIYKNVSPRPQPSVRFYTGDKAFFQYLPYLNRIYVQVPIGVQPAEETLPVGTFRLPEPVQRDDFPLLLSMIPLTKGIPASVTEKQFYFSIRPQVEKKGYLTVALHFPEGLENEKVSLFIDGTPVSLSTEQRELSAGIHQLRVVSAAFREINTSVAVESGKANVVEVQLEPLSSGLTIDAPSGAELYLDGEKLPEHISFPLRIKAGSHLLRAKIGDRSVSKKFSIERGKHYHLSVVFDIIINED